jgi:hypothetical protein
MTDNETESPLSQRSVSLRNAWEQKLNDSEMTWETGSTVGEVISVMGSHCETALVIFSLCPPSYAQIEFDLLSEIDGLLNPFL